MRKINTVWISSGFGGGGGGGGARGGSGGARGRGDEADPVRLLTVVVPRHAERDTTLRLVDETPIPSIIHLFFAWTVPHMIWGGGKRGAEAEDSGRRLAVALRRTRKHEKRRVLEMAWVN